MSDKLKKWRDDNKTDDIKILKSTLFGYIFYIDIPIVEISSTMIRQCNSTNETMDEYLPSNIINRYHYYKWLIDFSMIQIS